MCVFVCVSVRALFLFTERDCVGEGSRAKFYADGERAPPSKI